MKTYQFSCGQVYASVVVLTEESDIVLEDPYMEGQWMLTNLYSKSKRSGCAKELMAQIFERAKSEGVEFIAVWPFAREGIDQKSLVKFYKSVAFEDDGHAFVESL